MKYVPFKEVLLLTLPTLILWGAGSWWKKHEQRGATSPSAVFNERDTYRVEVVDVEKSVPSPVEVAQGFDTRFVFTFKESSNKFPLPDDKQGPSGFAFFSVMPRRFSVREKNQWREIRLPPTSPLRGGYRPRHFKRGDRVFAITVPMAKLPSQELRLEATALLRTMRQVPKGSVQPVPGKVFVSNNGSAPTFDSVTYLQSCPVNLTLRKAGEKIVVPQVSRARSFRLRSVKVTPFNPQTPNPLLNPYPGTDTRVDIEIQNTTQKTAPEELSWSMIGPQLLDKNGKEYFKSRGFSNDLSDEAFHREGFTRVSSTESEGSAGIYRMTLWFATDFIPENAAPVTLKAKISVRGEWPWEISTVIRNPKQKSPL